MAGVTVCGVLLGACGSGQVRASSDRVGGSLHRPVAQRAGWEAVLPSPEVAMDERCLDRDTLPEASTRDAALAVRHPRAVDAITSSWPVEARPSLDRDRTGRTSTNPERFIYSSDSPYPRRGIYGARWYRRY
ncbi:MAG: hypothetical protein ACIARR_10115 [Phycisphaerales bacterium JB059]